MTILVLILACIAVGIAAFFLLLMRDGRRLRERMIERRPAFLPEEAEPETPLFETDYPLWMSTPFAGPEPPHAGGHRSVYSTTPESPGLG